MRSGLYAKVQQILNERGETEIWLQAAMIACGIKYHPRYMDIRATAHDIRIIADIIAVPPSVLFETTSMRQELVDALFEEYLPLYEDRIDVTRQEAYEKVIAATEFRGSFDSTGIRDRVRLSLEGLCRPSGKLYGCEYPDCDDCGIRCKATGRMIGPEG